MTWSRRRSSGSSTPSTASSPIVASRSRATRRCGSARPARASCTGGRSRTSAGSWPSRFARSRRRSRSARPLRSPRSAKAPSGRLRRLAPRSARQGEPSLFGEEGLGAELDPAEVGEPHGEPEGPHETQDIFAPHVARAVGPVEERREVLEDRVRDGLERQVPAGLTRRVAGERAESLVFPANVVRALRLVRDAQSALAFRADEPGVAEERAKDHLELDRVRRNAPEGAARVLDHVDECGRALLPPPSGRRNPAKNKTTSTLARRSRLIPALTYFPGDRRPEYLRRWRA